MLKLRSISNLILVATAALMIACGGGDSDKAAPEPIAEAAEDAQANAADSGEPTDEPVVAEAEAAPADEPTIDPPNMERNGTLTLKEYSVAFIGSANMGKGTLQVGNQTRGFRIGGLGIGGIGVAAIDATGNVYHMANIEDFTGVYGKARIGATAADMGKGRLWLKNPNGVVIELYTKMEGLALTAGLDGIVISWEADYQEGLQGVKDGSEKAWDGTKSGTKKAVDAVKKPFQ
jgi:hypothetical protein